mmetsp:Transcript_44253/g.105942  ORF Transcript_44253/g.105942 Transcript_44253/m.105942 type:complete len:234 (-) Transcript_44253:139-840(-)
MATDRHLRIISSPLLALLAAMQGPVAHNVQGQVVAGLQTGWAITQDRAQAGWAVTREKAQAGWGVARERAHAGCLAAKERVDTLCEGKALLDRGGLAAERAVQAKASAREAAAHDAGLAENVAKAIATLENAVAQLRAGREPAEGLPDGIAGMQDFEALADAYASRAELYRQLLNSLQALPQAPRLSAAEEDAVRILQLREGCQRAVRKTRDGYEAVKERRCRSPCSNRQAWC